MTSILLALSLGPLADASGPVKILAVIGAAAVGALGLGWLTQAIVRLSAGQQMPPWLVWTVRGLGGVACGWLAALWLFSSGGDGIGGPGGSGTGAGKDKDRETKKAKTSVSKDKEKAKDR